MMISGERTIIKWDIVLFYKPSSSNDRKRGIYCFVIIRSVEWMDVSVEMSWHGQKQQQQDNDIFWIGRKRREINENQQLLPVFE